jgi:hypothetical protein
MSLFKTSTALGALVAAAVIPLAATAADPQAAIDQDVGPAIADSQIVARDPATGQIRPATAEEAQQLRRARAERLRAGGPITSATHTHWSGARGARLTDEFMNYSVVVRTADGKLVELCVQDPSTVTAKPQQAKPELPTE